MATTVNKKMGKLYESLTPKERARMLAKLAREGNRLEIERLRNATPPEHSSAYNRALGFLRTLNGNLPDWLSIFHVSMERDRYRFNLGAIEHVRRTMRRLQLGAVWKLVSYPVTESEYRALVKMQRAEPWELEGYAEHLAELEGNEPGLNPAIAELLQNLPPDLQRIRGVWTPVHEILDPEKERDEEAYRDDHRRAAEIQHRILALMEAAIERGELPKPKRKDGELTLPEGTLKDWGEGTTPDTFEPYAPDHFVPGIDEFFSGGVMLGRDEWEIHPDSEAEAVKARRETMRTALLELAGVPHPQWDRFPSFDPPLTSAARRKAEKLAATLHDEWFEQGDFAALILAAAETHAVMRAQLEGIAQAIETLTRDEFGGEDPLMPETRATLEAAQEEAATFVKLWQQSERELRIGLYEASGKKLNLDEPFPLPEKEPDDMLPVFERWAASS